MLTADLARSRTSDGEVTPLFIDPDDAGYRETASELIELFETTRYRFSRQFWSEYWVVWLKRLLNSVHLVHAV